MNAPECTRTMFSFFKLTKFIDATCVSQKFQNECRKLSSSICFHVRGLEI